MHLIISPTIWYQAVLPAGGIGFGFENLTGNPNINVFNNNCASLTQFGACITATSNLTSLTPGTYLIAVRNTDPGAAFTFDIKTIIPPSNDLCASGTTLSDNVQINGTTACATPFNTGYCGLNTTTSHTVFYNYTVPAGNTTNTNLDFTILTNTATTGTAASDLNIGLFTNCGGTVYNASVASGDPCDPTTGVVRVECVAPGTVLTIAIGSNNNAEGDFSIRVDETNVGIPANDLCAAAQTITIANNCDFQTVNGTTLNACPEVNTTVCGVDNFPTVWYSVTLPASAIGLGFDNLSAGLNIAILTNSCAAPVQIGACVTGTIDINSGLTGGNTYFLAVRNTDPGAPLNFDIKTIVPPANDLCANATALTDNVQVNGTTACATPFATSYCGLSTTTSHTVFYTYVVPAGNTTNTNLEFTILSNTATTGTAATDLNIGLFTNCSGSVYTSSLASGDLCAPTASVVVVECVAPGTTLTIAIGSNNNAEGDFSIKVDETNAGIPANDLCAAAQLITIANNCDFQTVGGTTSNACPETNSAVCGVDNFPTVWFRVTLPVNGIGFGFENLSVGLNIAILTNNCTTPVQIGSCITGTIDAITGFTAGNTYLLAVRNADPGGLFNFDIKTIVPPSNDLCANAVALADNVQVNGTTACATPFATSYCGLSTTTSHTVFYSYTVPAGNTTNTDLEFTILPNILTTGTPASDLNIGLFTNCSGTVYNATVDAPGDLCLPVGSTITVSCVAPGTVLTIAIGSNNNAEGDFSINVNETSVGIPVNDLCLAPTVITIVENCEFQPVTGTTLGACPETFAGGACALNNFATVWYQVVLPAGGVGFGFQNLSPGLNIAIFNNSCPNPTQVGACVTGNIDITTGFVPGTYLIAVRNTLTGAAVSFDIKTILFLANDDPCMPGFVATPLANATLLPNQNNTCATDDNTCAGAAVANTLWYTFTLSAPNDKITINVAGLTSPSIGIYTQVNPCLQTPVNEECNGDGMVEFNCLAPGTYSIMIGTSLINAGIFSVTATQGTNASVPNDLCSMATLLPGQPYDLCVDIPGFTSTNLNACPEPGLASVGMCNFQTQETSWYTFVAPGVAPQAPTMDFTYTAYTGAGTPFMGLFTGGCGGLTAVTTTCLSGLNTVFGNIGPLTPGQTYYIALSSFGDTGGNSTFSIKFNIGPPNDNKCADLTAYNLGSGGTLLSQTNLCSGGDYTITTCPATDSQNSVWYTFTVDPGSYGINIYIDQILNNGMPLLGPIAAGVFPDGCTSNVTVGTLCFPAKTDQVLDCLEPGTYDLQISTSTANAGEFTITTSQLVDNRSCPADSYSSDFSDLCADAININMAGIICEDILVKGCNTNACPENFTSPGCSFNQNPTVWFKFTVDANASTVDITGMTGGYEYAILVNDPCTDSPPTGLASYLCLTAANTTGIPITGGATYYLLVSDPNGGTFAFNIKQNVLPVNDDPIPSSPRPPFDLPLDGGHSSTTCCAVGFADNPNLDFPNVSCAGATEDGAVWYTYTTGTEIGIEVQVFPSGSNPISGNTTVEVLTGSAAGPGGLFSPTSVSCDALPAIIKLSCYDPGQVIWIKVASADGECGDFSINLVTLSRCQQADECDEIGASQTLGPTMTDPNCGAFVIFTADGCLESSCPQDDVAGCGLDVNPTVWFQVTVDIEAVQLATFVTTNGSWQPVWAIFQGPCDALAIVNGGTIAMPTPCSNGDSNAGEHTVGVIQGVDTYYIGISAQGLIDDPNFTLTLYTSAGCVSCIGGDQGCNTTAEFEITQRSSDRPLDDLNFCQGEEVTVCVNYLYDASQTGVDWFHGLIPNFGPGWDLDAFDPTAVTVSPGNPEWNDEDDGACAPFITEQMPLLCTYTDPQTGRLKLCNIACEICPCAAPLVQDSPLPSGWFWSTNGGAGCLNDCSPSTHYGIGQVVVNINFCVDLKVREFDNQADCNANKSLQFNFQTTSDGVSGCWNDPVAECKLDKAQIGPAWQIDCRRPPKVLGNDDELCHEGIIDIDLTNEAGIGGVDLVVTHIPNPDVTGAMDHLFTNGSGTIDDYLTNTSANTTIQEYEAYIIDPTILCPAPKDTFRVTIYAELIVQLPLLDICAENIGGVEMIPTISGGTGNYVGYAWSTGENTPTITIYPTSPSTISVTVTDDKGCRGPATVNVNKLLPVNFAINPASITSCANDVVFQAINFVSNGNPVISWNVPGELYFIDLGDQISINLPFSNPQNSPYTIQATLTDQYGCNITKEAILTISIQPSGELGNVTPACGQLMTDISILNYITNTSPAPPVTFKLLDCGGNQVYGTGGTGQFGAYILYDPTAIFEDVDLSLSNCFQLLIEEQGGCTFVSPNFTIPITSGTPVQISPATTICNGKSTTISILNPASYTGPGAGFVWSPSGAGPSFSVMPTMTTQYSVTATQSNGCTSVASTIISVDNLPIAAISGSTTYCAGANTQLTASGGTSYVWSGPSAFTASTDNTGAINTPGTYNVTVTDMNGCTATASETISQSSQLTLTIADIVLCNNNLDSLNAGAGFDTYLWKNSSNVTVGTSQFLTVTQAGTYTVNVTQGICTGTGTGIVINNNTPVLNLPDSTDVCRLNTGIGPVTIDFVSLADTTNGFWLNIDNATVNTSNWGNVDFTTVLASGYYRFVFNTNNAVAPCINVSDAIVVQVNNCPCPTPALIALPDVCNSSTIDVKLSSIFVGNPLPGVWSVVAPSPLPFPTITNDSLKVTGINEGVYTIRYTYQPPSPGTCAKFIETTLSVYNASSLTLKDEVLCNMDIGSGPTTLNLNDLIVSVNQPSPGTWKQIKGTAVGGTIPNIDVSGMAIDTLEFEYTTTAAGACPPVTEIAEVRIRNCSCPDVVLLPDTLCNGSMTLLDLQLPSKFMVLPANVTGTWTSPVNGTISAGHFFNPFGVTANSYVVKFKVSGTLPAGCQSTFDKMIEIKDQPLVTVDKDGSACSTVGANGTTQVNLNSLLDLSNTSNGGTWKQISPALPLLVIPVNNIIDLTGQTPGVTFIFEYSVPGTSPCNDAKGQVNVLVKDCNCPDGDIACVSPNCDLCNDSGILDLTSTIVNPLTFAPGVWTVSGPVGENIPLVNTTILDAKGLTAGTYKVKYTLTPKPSGNCPDFDEFTLKISNKAIAVVTPDTLLCNSAQTGEIFSLTALVKSGFGAWSDDDGISVTAPVSLEGLTEGTVLNFTFTVGNTPPCTPSVYPVTLSITENCNCEQIVLGPIRSMCTNEGSFDLKAISSTPVPGTWKSSNPLLVITNGIIALTGVKAGVYEIIYALDAPEPNCPKERKVNITVSNPKSAGTARGAEFCIGATDLIKLFDRLDNEDTGGTWSVVSGGTAGFDAAKGEFNLTGRAAGSYIFKYEFKNQTPCPDDSEEVTIKINALPIADAGNDQNIDCSKQTAILGTNLTSTGINIVYEWKLLNNIVGTTQTIIASKGGDYVLTVRDTLTKCSDDDMVIVVQADDLPIFDVVVDTILCFGQTATITLSNLSGGKAPYEISFDGGKTYAAALIADNLKAGSYKVQVKDANGCVNDQLPAIVIVEPVVFTVKLVDDFVINVGEDSLLTIKGQYNELTAQSVIWKANGVEVATSKDQPTLKAIPTEDTEYTVTVINESGCIATDMVKISIKRVKPECVPNIFSPNQADANEYFSINCDEVDLVTKYRIYDRWGNLLFTGENLSPSNPSSFWDGEFKGKPVVPGVYVYYLEMLFKDGSTEKRGGDVTVIR
ncbi:MAG: gliding motility-associated C-terminal domain-containing protein [Saprospiraceae bacterium]|nr:gliding motility-associated C-terminal domain-containing protein [Saprospiraceae bacterium]